MAKPYSMDLRGRAVARVTAGESTRTVAALFAISVSSIIKWGHRQRRTGSVAPGKMGGHRPRRITGEHETWLLQRVANDPDVTLRGLEEEFRPRGLAADHATVGRFLRRKGRSFKKKTLFAVEQKRPAIARFRARWMARQGKIDPRRLVFLDETWLKTNMAPLRGWGAARQAAAGLRPL